MAAPPSAVLNHLAEVAAHYGLIGVLGAIPEPAGGWRGRASERVRAARLGVWAEGENRLVARAGTMKCGALMRPLCSPCRTTLFVSCICLHTNCMYPQLKFISRSDKSGLLGCHGIQHGIRILGSRIPPTLPRAVGFRWFRVGFLGFMV